MASGERQQADQQEAQPEPGVPVPEDAVVLAPAVTAEVALPTGAHASEGVGGMRDLLTRSSPGERRRFVLQLQRTAGNAAVCRWLGIGRAKAQRHAGNGDGDPPDDVLALLEELGGPPEEPPEPGGPRRR